MILDYFRKLTKSNSGESSKRFTQLYSLGLITIVIIFSMVGVYYGKVESNVISTILYILAGLVTGQSILTVVQSNSESNSKSTSTTSTATATATTDNKSDDTSENKSES